MRHDPGLDASPPVRFIMEVERNGYSTFHSPTAVDRHPPREAAAYVGTSAQEDLLWAYGCLHLEEFRRVTDGTRTRALRSHNPLSSVSGRCQMLQNRLI